MKVSIIIPVYNVEKYIDRCLESVVNQTYKNLEVILVDDGSTDNSGKICDAHKEKYKMTKVIHKENGGLSSARNEGLKYVTGQYVFYLDSDDYISKDCIEHLVKISTQKNADISIIKMINIAENTNEEIKELKNEKLIVMNSEKAIKESLYQKKYSCCAPAKLYKTEIAKQVKFPLGKLAEDLATCHNFFDISNVIVYSSHIGYYYRQQDNSIMHKFNKKRMDALKWSNEIEKFCEKKYPKIHKAAECRTFNVAIHLLLDLKNDVEDYDKIHNEIWSNIKRTRKSVIFNIESRNREKIAALISFFGEKTLKLVWNSKIAIKRKNN